MKRRPKAKKRKKYAHIDWFMIEQEYVMRDDRPSLTKLSEEMNADSGQMSRVSTKNHWEEKRAVYWKKVSVRTQELSVQSSAERLAENLRMVRAVKLYVMKQLVENKLKVSGSDMDKMIRLEAFLGGEADSRVESLVKVYEIDEPERIINIADIIKEAGFIPQKDSGNGSAAAG